MKSGNKKLILAIEAAIGGGSLALMSNGDLVAELSSGPEISRAAGLVPAIDGLFKSSGLALKDLASIAVSVGPGSYTGVRVGIATALGLARSVGIELLGVSTLRGLAAASDTRSAVVAALPVGREDIAWQVFDNGQGLSEPRVGSPDDLAEALRTMHLKDSVIRHIGLAERLAALPAVVDAAQEPLAVLLALAAHQGFVETDLTPLYLLNPARGRNLF